MQDALIWFFAVLAAGALIGPITLFVGLLELIFGWVS